MTAFRLPASRKTKSERSGMANATIRLRLTAVRLFYDHLIEEGLRGDNPVGRGRYTQGGGFGGVRPRALVPRFTALPWIPAYADWRHLLHTAKSEPLRNRVMLAWLALVSAFGGDEHKISLPSNNPILSMVRCCMRTSTVTRKWCWGWRLRKRSLLCLRIAYAFSKGQMCA